MLIEFPDPAERARQLAVLKGIEDMCWVQVKGHGKVFAIADEDLERENEEKTSSVHFLRFELTRAMIESLRDKAGFAVGIDHPNYQHASHLVRDEMRLALYGDLSLLT